MKQINLNKESLFYKVILIFLISLIGPVAFSISFSNSPSHYTSLDSEMVPQISESGKENLSETVPQILESGKEKPEDIPAYKQSPFKNPAEKTRKIRMKTKESQWILFRWLDEQQISAQWAYGFLNEEQKYMPSPLAEDINSSFKKDMFLYLNFHYNLLQFPYVLKWGAKASTGFTRNYDVDSTYFIPLSLSIIFHLQIFKYQYITPFFELGYSTWNIDFSNDFSEFFPFWNVGAYISLSIFKRSLRHTMEDEYGITDIGIVIDWRSYSSPFHFEERAYFLRSFHAGIYFRF